ncbi:MAG: tRNA (guanosine(46)-N7)-methyltransferase TrmB [Neisseriaceae bacterium]
MDDKRLTIFSQTRGNRSYVLRQGLITVLQTRAIKEGLPIWGLPYGKEIIKLDEIFGRTNAKILEIGFGMGHTIAEMARRQPDLDYLGIEVYSPGVGNLLHLIKQEGLTNIRIIQYDAVQVLESMLQDEALTGVHIYFPDPWPKRRHHKRRLIQAPFIQLLVQKVKKSGYIHLATDWKEYAYQMLEVLTAEKTLVNKFTAFAPRPAERPLTKFELRGQRLGHSSWDLLFEKKPDV